MQSGWLVDASIAAFLLLQTFLGWRRGFLWQAAGVASIAFGVLLGLFFSPALGDIFSDQITSNPFHARLIAFMFILGSVGLSLRLAAAWAEVSTERGLPKKEKEKRRAEDRILGGIFGAVKGSVIALVLIAAAVSLQPESTLWNHSLLATPLSDAGSRLLPGGAAQDALQWATRSVTQLCKELDIK